MKIIGIFSALLVGLLFVLFLGAEQTRANLSRIQDPVSCSTQGTSATSLSTTSVRYLTAGNGTTTATCNMSIAGLGTEVFDTAILQIQYAGSSSPTSLINVYIQDSPTGQTNDWYFRSLGWNVDESSASSSPSIGGLQAYTFAFASSTPSLGATNATNGATTTRSIRVPVQNRFIRAIIVAPIGATPGAVWANWVGKTEVSN